MSDELGPLLSRAYEARDAEIAAGRAYLRAVDPRGIFAWLRSVWLLMRWHRASWVCIAAERAVEAHPNVTVLPSAPRWNWDNEP